MKLRLFVLSFILVNIVHIANASDTWVLQSEIGLYNDFSAIRFIDARTGIACEKGNMFQSVDGGLTWKSTYQQSNDPVLNKDDIQDWKIILFSGKDTGYAFCARNAFLKTVDGGASWSAGSLQEGPAFLTFESGAILNS